MFSHRHRGGVAYLRQKYQETRDRKPLTLELLYDPDARVDFSGSPPTVLSWFKDGKRILVRQNKGGTSCLMAEAESGGSETLVDEAVLPSAVSEATGVSQSKLRPIYLDQLRLSPDEQTFLFEYAGDLFLYAPSTRKAEPLSHGKAKAELADFSPDGKMVSFVRQHDLYVLSLSARQETRLTYGGGPELLNGKLDWVHQQSIYEPGNFCAYWWSPDSARLAYLQLDESKVPKCTVMDDLDGHREGRTMHYPKAGQANPVVRLGIVEASGGPTEWVSLLDQESADLLIVQVGWTPSAQRLFFQVQNRIQTWLDARLYTAETGQTVTLFRERTPAWTNFLGEAQWLESDSFLWLSERTGWKHIYLYDSSGDLVSAITSGSWNVREILSVDRQQGRVYFTADREGPTEQHLYATDLDGGDVIQISREPGTHRAVFNSQSTLFIDTWSDILTPPEVSVRRPSGEVVQVIHPSAVESLRQFETSQPEFHQVATQEGFPMEAMMIRPPDFDSLQKYPVLIHIYGAPQSPKVKMKWGGTDHLWHQHLAQQGYIVWMCDTRTASGKGALSAWPLYRRVGQLELADLEDGVTWLRQQSYVDGNRIGIWGWSFGGYLTCYAMTHSKSFRMGIAGAQLPDWRLYDTLYTERYMGLPEDNPDGYRRGSVLEAAGNLHGKLLLIHGVKDANCHVQDSLRLAKKLQKARKDFQMELYPNAQHIVRDPKQVNHLREIMTRFVLENL